MTNIVVILVEPKTQGNIGAVARAMLNFGVHELRIVGDVEITDEARNRAVHAQDVLNNIVFYPDLAKAVKDVNLRAATTGKVQDNQKRHMRSYLELEEFARNTVTQDGTAALIFGREDYGLYNEELALCDVVVNIPTSQEYPILNLSHAVSLVLYQLFIEDARIHGEDRDLREAAPSEMNRLYDRTLSLLRKINYPEHKEENTTVMIRRIVGRSFISRWEFHTLMGVFRRIERQLNIEQENDGEDESVREDGIDDSEGTGNDQLPESAERS